MPPYNPYDDIGYQVDQEFDRLMNQYARSDGMIDVISEFVKFFNQKTMRDAIRNIATKTQLPETLVTEAYFHNEDSNDTQH